MMGIEAEVTRYLKAKATEAEVRPDIDGVKSGLDAVHLGSATAGEIWENVPPAGSRAIDASPQVELSDSGSIGGRALKLVAAAIAIVALIGIAGQLAPRIVDVATDEELVDSADADSSDLDVGGDLDEIPAVTTTIATVEDGGFSWEASPLEEFLGVVLDPNALSEGYASSYVAWAEETTACMSAEGFDGWVEEVAPIPSRYEFVEASHSALTWATPGALQEFEYGIWGTKLFQLDLAESRLIEKQSFDVEASNQAYFESLDEPSQQSLAATLSKCSREAQEAHPLPDASMTAAVGELLVHIEHQVEDDPAVVEAVAEWSACVRQAGYGYESRAEAQEALRAQAPGIPFVLSNKDLDFEDIQRLRTIVEQISIDEFRLVAIDLQCVDSSGRDEIAHEVRFAIEENLIGSEGDNLLQLLATEETS